MSKKLEFDTDDRDEVIRLLNSRSYIGVRNYLNQLKVSEVKEDEQKEVQKKTTE